MKLSKRAALFVLERWFERDTHVRRLFVRRAGTIRQTAFGLTLAVYPAFCGLSWVGTAARRTLGLKPRVVWGPTPILTIAESSALLRRLGYPSTTVVYSTYYIRTDFDVNLQRPIWNESVSYWLPNLVFLWSLLRFDVFHFFYDGGLWSGMRFLPSARWLELPLLRLAGKRVIASAYGADVRVREVNEMWEPFNICRECPQPGLYCVCGSEGLTRSKYYRDWSNAVLAMGDMHDFVFDSRKDFSYWPIDTDEIRFVGAAPRTGPVRVVHSPTQPYFKGTRFIEAAVVSLRSRGYDVELDLVEGVPNDEARRRYQGADIVFAQCLAGWIGYTELEAMAAGKPVLGYIRDPSYLAHTDGCPLVSASPDTLEQELERLVTDPALREELGRRGREYVEREWSYTALGPAYDELHREVWTRNELARTLRRKWSDFLRSESGYRVGRPLSGSQLGEWVVYADPFVAMRRIESGLYGAPPFDADGIPRVHYGGTYVEHPGVVALYALNAFHLHLAEPDHREHLELFLIAARWLRDRLEIESGVGRWQHRFAAIDRDLTIPWVSCFTQSLALSVLLRAAQREPHGGFGERAAAAAELFRVPVADGGVLYEEDGHTYLEEYPEPDPAHVLNGFVTGSFGLHEYARATGEDWAASLFDRCATTIKRTLPAYEAPEGRIRYDASSESLAPHDYDYFVVQQLRALHAITGDSQFGSWARRWSRRLYTSKVRAFVRLEEPF